MDKVEHSYGFESVSERVKGESVDRLKHGKARLTYGIDYLDRCTRGIMPNDLIVLAGRSGEGKTEFATGIALHNAYQQKRVHFFALEAEPTEIERRLKFKLLADKYFKNLSVWDPKYNIAYDAWRVGELEQAFAKYEADVEVEFKTRLSSLNTFYRESVFDIHKFSLTVTSIQSDTDLIIVDHLNFFDYDERHEASEVSKIVKEIRDVALQAGKPVILLAHVRKKDRKDDSIMPELEDIHGSSNIFKMATYALTIAPAWNTQSHTKLETYVRVAKHRFNGGAKRFVGKCIFDIQKNMYLKQFMLGRYTPGMAEFEALDETNWPDWARGEI